MTLTGVSVSNTSAQMVGSVNASSSSQQRRAAAVDVNNENKSKDYLSRLTRTTLPMKLPPVNHSHSSHNRSRCTATATPDINTATTTSMNKKSHLLLKSSLKLALVVLVLADVIVTAIVRLYARNDQLKLTESFDVRFSSLNLLATCLWSTILIVAILYDIYTILLFACMFNLVSLGALAVLTLRHFTTKIDYSNADYVTFLALLTVVIALHAYMLAMTMLTACLVVRIKRQRRQQHKIITSTTTLSKGPITTIR